MTVHTAEKVVIISEKIIADKICKIINDLGATGYTVTPAAGKGSRNMRGRIDHTNVVDDFSNIKIEVIVNNLAMAERIMDVVKEKFFEHFSGITYVEEVKVLRPHKFDTHLT